MLHQAGASAIDGAVYTLDADGSRTAKTDELAGVTSNYTYDKIYELTGASSASYTYDYNGNTTPETNSSGTTNYTWDHESRLANVTLPGQGGTVTFKYDPFGRRIQKHLRRTEPLRRRITYITARM